eukprot:jgi/Chlat1/7710/Chrsp66S07184
MANAKRFDGKVFLVTGASSGIGAVTSEHLAAQGAHVWVAARRQDQLDALVAKINAAGGKATAAVLDVTDAAQVDKVVADIATAHGRLDGAFNNAGYAGPSLPVSETDLDDLARVLSINVTAQAACMRAELRQMLAQGGGGSIVNNSSAAGTKALALTANYCASKAALNHFSLCAAAEVAKSGVRINVVAPGFTTPSEMFDKTLAQWAALNPDMSKEVIAEKFVPIGRIADAEEIAAMVAYLFDDTVAKSITGQIIGVDGGAGMNFMAP